MKVIGYKFKTEEKLDLAMALYKTCHIQEGERLKVRAEKRLEKDGYHFPVTSYWEDFLKEKVLLENLCDKVTIPHKLVKGNWYKDTHNGKNSIIFYSGDNIEGNYGKSLRGYWTERYDINGSPLSAYILATEEEVEEAVINEAKHRGFIDGVKVKPIGINSNAHSAGVRPIRGYRFNMDTNSLDSDNACGWIFRNGEWAEIMEHELPIIKGLKGEVVGDNIKYGCALLSKSWFIDTPSRCIKSMTLDSGVTISERDVDTIREFIRYETK